ncbi:MAG TPA: hypothetical protein VFB45_16515 [Pseudolabrys sp.]|nr:hypothetical protein [Pseudolabrys sp.]
MAHIINRILRGGLLFSALIAVPGFAQEPGSAGGRIGKTEKSVSGADEQKSHSKKTTSDTSARRGGCGPILGNWLWDNGVAVRVNANNTTTQSDGNSASLVCADGVYSFTWFGFATARMMLSSDGKRLSGSTPIGVASAVRR